MRYARPAASFLVLVSVLAVGACAPASRYAVVAPAAARGVIARNAGPIVSRDGVDYELFQVENRLVLRFVNRTSRPIALGEGSVMIDAAGRSFGVEPQELPPDASGRVVVPPTNAAERERTTPLVAPVRVGGVDEGGLIGTRRDVEMNAAGSSSGAAAAPAPGFRWRPGQAARVRLVFRVPLATTMPATAPTAEGAGTDGTISHEWTLRHEQ